METNTTKLLEFGDFKKAYKGTEIPNCKYLKIKSPLSIQFELTSGCNQNCIFCYNVWKGLCSKQDSITLPKEKQLEMVKLLNRLPAVKEALEDPLIVDNPILKGSADQMVVGTPMPTVLEMRCNWDSMKPEMLAVLSDTKSPEDAAELMQSSAESCIKSLE